MTRLISYDGDTVSFSVLYTDESIKEIKEYLNSPKAYLTPSGELIDSNADDNINIVIDVLSE